MVETKSSETVTLVVPNCFKRFSIADRTVSFDVFDLFGSGFFNSCRNLVTSVTPVSAVEARERVSGRDM